MSPARALVSASALVSELASPVASVLPSAEGRGLAVPLVLASVTPSVWALLAGVELQKAKAQVSPAVVLAFADGVSASVEESASPLGVALESPSGEDSAVVSESLQGETRYPAKSRVALESRRGALHCLEESQAA